MSQGDLLMQRKRHNNGEHADEESARRYPSSGNAPRVPLRKSIAESSQFVDTLKKNGASKGKPSICLTAPTSGSMNSSYAAVPRTLDDPIKSREERQRMIIEERKREEEEVRALDQVAKEDYLGMLREAERMRLRQRTHAREILQEKTLPSLCGSARTVAAAQREMQKLLPQKKYIESNIDRIEVSLIRRDEERASLERKKYDRRGLELSVGTVYSNSQATLSSRAHVPLNHIVTPEEAHSVMIAEEEEKWQKAEEEKDIQRAMDELDALDARLYRDEVLRKEERMAKKRELRDASMRK